MYRHQLHQPLTAKIIFNWFLMSLNAGAINAGGFLATGRFVSHVTGFSTLFGVNLVRGNLQEAWGILLIPVFFMSGAFIAGLLIDRPLYRNQKPHFDYVMGLSALCLFTAGFTGILSQFGAFGDANEIHENFFLLVLTCMACGLQNATLTSSSGTSVRTTHLTGLTTDLGLGMAKLLTIERSHENYPREKRSNLLRLGTIFAFIGGSILGAFTFIHFHYQGFILCGLISLYAAWVGRKEKQAPHQTQTVLD